MAEERPASGNPILSLLASSAGLSGLLVVVGFFIQQGIRSMMGVAARRSLDVTSYLIDVAYFVEDSLGSLFDHLQELAFTLLIAGLVAVLAWRLFRRVPDFARRRGVLFAAVMLAFLVKLFYIDYPVILISDFFRRPAVEAPTPNFHAPGFLAGVTNDRWLDLLRAHDVGKGVHHWGRDEIEDDYARMLLFASLIIGACLLLLRANREDNYASVLVVVAIAELLVTAYAYGKFEQSTFYPCVALSLREPANPATLNVILMSEDGDNVTVFNPKDDHFHRIASSEIREITMLESNDVLGAHMLAVPPAIDGFLRERLLARNDRLRREKQLPRCLD